jgi:hypothetical protein
MADQHFVLWNATLAVASLQEEVLAFDARQQKCPLSAMLKLAVAVDVTRDGATATERLALLTRP